MWKVWGTVPGARGREDEWGRWDKGSWYQGAGREVGKVGEGVLGPGDREEGWGRSGKGPRTWEAGRRDGGGRGRVPGPGRPGGGVGEAGGNTLKTPGSLWLPYIHTITYNSNSNTVFRSRRVGYGFSTQMKLNSGQ